MENLLTIFCTSFFLAFINASPSDLGVFPNQNSLPNIVSTFSIPADKEQYVPIDVWVSATLNFSYIGDAEESVTRYEQAKYGEGRILNVEGRLVHVTSKHNLSDHTGCDEALLGTTGESLPVEPWIALIKRGRCTFEDKVKHAYAKNASGVIVYNDRDTVNLDKMKIIGKDRNITCVFTYKWVGEEFASMVDKGINVTVSINEGIRSGRPLANINRTSVLFVSISFIVLMIISLIWLVFYYVQRFRYLQTKDKQSRRLCSVAKRIISKIPTKTIKSGDKEIDCDCCAICIEPYKLNETVRVLPCNHEYHKTCIDPWLLEHRTCPMCKLDILKHYGFVFTGSQESILQLDDFDDVEIEINNPGRRNSVSPLPQIRVEENHQVRNSPIDTDSDVDFSSPTEETPSLANYSSVVNKEKDDVCISCLAVTLKRSRKSVDSALLDDSEDSDVSAVRYRHSSLSLPTTLKKNKHHYTAETCHHLSQANNLRRLSHSKIKSALQGCSNKVKMTTSTSFTTSTTYDKVLKDSNYSDDDKNNSHD